MGPAVAPKKKEASGRWPVARGGKGNMKKRGYEYEMSIPSIDSERAAIRIDSLSLAPSSGVIAGNAMTVCGVMLCAIRMKREIVFQQTFQA